DKADSQVHGANSSMGGKMGCGFPLAAYFREKACAGRRFFAEKLVATIAVVPDGRRANQCRRALLGICQRLRQILCAHNPAVADPLLLCFRPTPGYAFYGEMNHGLEAGDEIWRNSVQWVPRNLVRSPRRPSHETSDFMSMRFE